MYGLMWRISYYLLYMGNFGWQKFVNKLNKNINYTIYFFFLDTFIRAILWNVPISGSIMSIQYQCRFCRSRMSAQCLHGDCRSTTLIHWRREHCPQTMTDYSGIQYCRLMERAHRNTMNSHLLLFDFKEIWSDVILVLVTVFVFLNQQFEEFELN